MKVAVYEKLVKALDNYISVLGNELADVVSIASVHGWRSTRYDEGVKARKRIAGLRDQLKKARERYELLPMRKRINDDGQPWWAVCQVYRK